MEIMTLISRRVCGFSCCFYDEVSFQKGTRRGTEVATSKKEVP